MGRISATAAALVLSASAALGCEMPREPLLTCDLIGRSERLEFCGLIDRETATSSHETYSYGTPGDPPDLTFRPEAQWGATFHEGYVEHPDLSSWGVGLVHPNGRVFVVYAYGDYGDDRIRRGVLQVFPDFDSFTRAKSTGVGGDAIYHAECRPETIEGYFGVFRP
ncbi:MAG: hypothetical protein AAF919_03670 [Pseudomonadota bacterium]